MNVLLRVLHWRCHLPLYLRNTHLFLSDITCTSNTANQGKVDGSTTDTLYLECSNPTQYLTAENFQAFINEGDAIENEGTTTQSSETVTLASLFRGYRIYVSEDGGSDGGDCGSSESSPCKSISKAYNSFFLQTAEIKTEEREKKIGSRTYYYTESYYSSSADSKLLNVVLSGDTSESESIFSTMWYPAGGYSDSMLSSLPALPGKTTEYDSQTWTVTITSADPTSQRTITIPSTYSSTSSLFPISTGKLSFSIADPTSFYNVEHKVWQLFFSQ